MYEQPIAEDELEDVAEKPLGRVYTRAAAPAQLNFAPTGAPDGDDEGRRAVGVRVDGEILRGFPTPSGLLEFYSPTLVDWGWKEYAIPTYIKSHVHPENMDPDQMVLISTFRYPCRSTPAAPMPNGWTRSPTPIPSGCTPRCQRIEVKTGDLVRVETEIGHFRGQGLGHRGHQAGRGRLQPSHGPVEDPRRGSEDSSWPPRLSTTRGTTGP